MKNSFKSNDKFNDLLYKQRHECRAKRQKLRTYGMKELYQELCEEYKLFKDYLPKDLHRVLDIGCGLGYIDVVISDHNPDLSFYMFDAASSGDGKVYLFYNNLELTREFLTLNDIPNERITLIDATSTGIEQAKNQNPDVLKGLPPIDLVVSTYAWGWHSRIPKFIAEVSEVLRPGGRVIIEVKGDVGENHHQDNLETIKAHGFTHLDSIQVMKGKHLFIIEKI